MLVFEERCVVVGERSSVKFRTSLKEVSICGSGSLELCE